MITGMEISILMLGVLVVTMAATNGVTEPVNQSIVTLQRGNTAERREAISVLSRLGDQRSISPLAQALHDPDLFVQQGAEQALWRIFHESGKVAIDTRLQDGIDALQRGALPHAIAVFTDVIEQAPDFAEGYNKRATTYYMMEEYEKSIDDCDRTLVLNPVHFGALSGAGLCYLRLRELNKALEYFERAVTINPNMPQIQQYIEDIKKYLRDQSL